MFFIEIWEYEKKPIKKETEDIEVVDFLDPPIDLDQ